MTEFKNLKFTGDISISPVTSKVPEKSVNFLVMGPTGAGKSSFIEALAGESQCLSISSNQLAGCTQGVTSYHVSNVTFNHYPIYLLDTPGFSDTKISELEIIRMVREWIQDNALIYVDRILYLTPITDTRLAGSKRGTLEMLKEFLDCSSDVGSMVFVTTMWDTPHNGRTHQRAEANFGQMQDELFKEFIHKGAKITRYLNTRLSALQILDNQIQVSNAFSTAFSGSFSAVSPQLYRDLHDRIEATLQQKHNIETDLAQEEAQTNIELKSILEDNLRGVKETLTKFIAQYVEYGPPPPGFQNGAQGLRKAIAASVAPEDSRYEELFRLWSQEPQLRQEIYIERLQQVIEQTSRPHVAVDQSSDHIPCCTPRKRALSSLLRRLINTARKCGSKWFNRRR